MPPFFCCAGRFKGAACALHPMTAARFPDVWRKKNEASRLPICYLLITRRNYESRTSSLCSPLFFPADPSGRFLGEVGKIGFRRWLCFAFPRVITPDCRRRNLPCGFSAQRTLLRSRRGWRNSKRSSTSSLSFTRIFITVTQRYGNTKGIPLGLSYAPVSMPFVSVYRLWGGAAT